MRIITLFFILLSTLFSQAPKVNQALHFKELNKLTASNASDGSHLGTAVAIDNSIIVVGAYGYLADSGRVYVYQYNTLTNHYDELAQLFASDAAEDDFFGASVAIEADTIVIGAYKDDDNGTDSGAIYVFEKPDTGWHNAIENLKLRASDAAVGDNFGHKIAIENDTIVVGAYRNDDNGTDSGSAYIFEKSASTWTQRAKLTASNASNHNNFGISVALNNDTVVVGASATGNYEGTAYIFDKPVSGWTDKTEDVKLNGLDTAYNDLFGTSVAKYNETIVIGAAGDSNASTDFVGSAYVFQKSAGIWTQSAKLTASDEADNNLFAIDVAISKDTILIGNNHNGSAYVFEKPVGNWVNTNEFDILKASDNSSSFGAHVGISDNLIVIGASYDNAAGYGAGAAYAFARRITQNTMENKKDILKLNASDADGDSITFSIIGGEDDSLFNIGSTSGLLSFQTTPDFENPIDMYHDNIYKAIIAVTDSSGESRTYDTLIRVSNMDYEGKSLPAQNYKEEHKLTASNASENNSMGFATDVDGNIMVVGAYGYNSNTGIAYVYEYNATTKQYLEVAQLSALDASTGNKFGTSIGISDSTIVIGAPKDDANGSSSGSVYIFEKPDTGWESMTQTQKITASDVSTHDEFGRSVGIDGNTMVIGMYGDNTATGSAYIFEKQTVNWMQVAKLTASDAATGDFFARSVAISADTVVAGAYLDDNDGGTDAGAAYIFERPLSGWKNATQNAKLTASDAASDDWFGVVDISGDTIAIGSIADDYASFTDAGSVYIFEKPEDGWKNATQNAKLTASDASDNDWFGSSVAVSGSTIVIGAMKDDDNGSNSGSAYIFDKSVSGWVDAHEDVKVIALDASTGDKFAESITMQGTTILIGASLDDNEGLVDAGSAYVFKGEKSKIFPAIIMYLLN